MLAQDQTFGSPRARTAYLTNCALPTARSEGFSPATLAALSEDRFATLSRLEEKPSEKPTTHKSSSALWLEIRAELAESYMSSIKNTSSQGLLASLKAIQAKRDSV
jgi:hypothetical protein